MVILQRYLLTMLGRISLDPLLSLF
uniref:Uncharacterized protein n=1 Tax=Rhizophora mucronata TaxID=61149 RepID=A0A2P2R4R4_RHIMU